MSDLFRPEAISSHSKRYGSVLHSGKRSYWWKVVGLAAGIAITAAGVTLIDYERWDIAQGITTFESTPVLVFPPYRAIVDKVFVKEGQVVVRGQELVRVRAPFASDSSIDPVSQQRDRLNALVESKARSERIAEQNTSLVIGSLTRRKQDLLRQRESIQFDLRSQIKETERIEQFIEKIEMDRYKEVLPKVQIMDYQSRLANARASESSMKRNLIDINVKTEEIDSEIAAIKSTRDREAEEAKAYIAQVESERLESVMLRKGSIYAQADGVVTTIQAKESSLVDQSEPILAITPRGSRIVGAANVSGDQALVLREGSPVRLRLQGFDYRIHGEVEAAVLTISATPVFQSTRQVIGADKDHASYRLSLAISEQSFRRVAGGASVRVGVPFDAVIRRSKGPLLEKFLARSKGPTEDGRDVSNLPK